MKYFGNINANNNTYYYENIELGTNKLQAAKDIRDMAVGEVYDNSTADWYLYDERQNEPIMSGTVRKQNGKFSYQKR